VNALRECRGYEVPLIHIIHNAVRGRTRFKVQGLYRNTSLNTHIENELLKDAEVTSAVGNVLTGHVLVLSHPACAPLRVLALLEHGVREYLASADRGTTCAGPAPSGNGNGSAATGHAVVLGTRLKKSLTAAASVAPQASAQWHATEAREVLGRLDCAPETGLTEDQALRHLEKFGPNVLPQSIPRSRLSIFLAQFKSLPVAMLGIVAGVSAITGGLLDAVVILGTVLLNGVIGFATENEAEKTIDSLRDLVKPIALVKRDGLIKEKPAQQVVVGDILILRPGVYVTADARLTEAMHLSVDESALTGESMPAVKSLVTFPDQDVPLPDRANMVYAGTLITGGQGAAVVVATAQYSEIGRVQALVSEAAPPQSPADRQLERIGHQLVLGSGAAFGLMTFIGLLRGQGVVQVFKTAILVALAAIPEGLPTVSTTALARGMRNMRRENVLIRDLEAVRTLGCVQTICFDKTGTITRNRMSVTRVFSGMRVAEVAEGDFVTGDRAINPFTSEELLRLLHVSVLCNESEILGNNGQYLLNGSPTENALVQLALVSGVDVTSMRKKYPLVETYHRSEDRPYMITMHECPGGGRLAALKGSPVDVLCLCEEQMRDGVRVPLTEDDRDVIESQNDAMAGDSLRVLGVAYEPENGNGRGSNGQKAIWLGLVGMEDPIRQRAKEAVAAFHRAGIETVMITGDQSSTAYAVGRALDLNPGKPLEILDATSLTGVDAQALRALAMQADVFARVSPSHKLQIVQAIQSAGAVVAMTGDGINDGPALKAADIGIAMGQGGTEVARQVADIVLETDNLETLIVAIGHGRTVYNNIRKSLHYFLATNFSEILVMMAGGALGTGYPLNAMQILWINLVSDIFPGIALALDAPESDVLDRPPREPDEPIVSSSDFKRIGREAAMLSLASLAAYGYGIAKYGVGPGAGTLAFQSLTIAQILHAWASRSETHGVFSRGGLPANPFLNASILGSLFVQLGAQFIPGLRKLLGTVPMSLMDWGVAVGASVIPLLVDDMAKKGAERNQP
jgi:P-type Ca2+ transporter type 2C